jgi:hypothetical protein
LTPDPTEGVIQAETDVGIRVSFRTTPATLLRDLGTEIEHYRPSLTGCGVKLIV